MKFLEKLTKKKLGELLVMEGLVTRDQVVDALNEQRRTGKLLGEILVSYGVVSEWDIASTIAKQFQLPFLLTSSYTIGREIQTLISAEVLHKYQAVPLDRFGNILAVAVSGLLTPEMVEELERLSACELSVYVGLPSDVRHTLEKTFPLPKASSPAEPWEAIFDAADQNVKADLKTPKPVAPSK
jgi:type IV pilus assembly protein PilB